MATCPKCRTTGGNWKHCKACNMFWCTSCRKKEGLPISSSCPFCGSMKTESKQPH
jgi:hypothetical protein